ncbi:MAG: hypothetical protein MK165_18355 [Pirellulaceae bacterium]|nr:hypothetical protein [Pirellulaceae bacterium]
MSYDESARRNYWIEHMERSFSLMQQMIDYPLVECGETLTSIPEAALDAGVEMLFSKTKIADRFDRIFFIRQSLISALMSIGADMNNRGWILKVEDGFRTRQMQTALGRSPEVFDTIVSMCLWECEGNTPSVELLDRRARCLVANYPQNGTHLMGAAVDISVWQRDDGKEVWRGAPYLDMSESTMMDSPFVDKDIHQNRQEITRMMEQHGFMHYPGEFWHYNQGDAAYHLLRQTAQPAIYGPIEWDAVSGTVTPFENLTSPLTPPDTMNQNLRAALDRLQNRKV